MPKESEFRTVGLMTNLSEITLMPALTNTYASKDWKLIIKNLIVQKNSTFILEYLQADMICLIKSSKTEKSTLGSLNCDNTKAHDYSFAVGRLLHIFCASN